MTNPPSKAAVYSRLGISKTVQKQLDGWLSQVEQQDILESAQKHFDIFVQEGKAAYGRGDHPVKGLYDHTQALHIWPLEALEGLMDKAEVANAVAYSRWCEHRESRHEDPQSPTSASKEVVTARLWYHSMAWSDLYKTAKREMEELMKAKMDDKAVEDAQQTMDQFAL